MTKKTGQKIFGVQMTKNRMFPFDVANENCVLDAQTSEVAELWHLRYGHLNIKGL